MNIFFKNTCTPIVLEHTDIQISASQSQLIDKKTTTKKQMTAIHIPLTCSSIQAGFVYSGSKLALFEGSSSYMSLSTL